MPAQGCKRAPAWSIKETLDLIAVWGEESVQAELRTSRRNADINAKIAQGMRDKGYTRDTQQCMLRQVFQRTREVNSRSGSEPQTCYFCEQLHAILCGDPTSTPTLSVDTSQWPHVATGNNEEETVDEEEEEEEENAQQASGGSILPDSQDLFLILESIPSQDQLLRNSDGEEGTSAATLSVGTSSTPAQRLSQIRRQKKRTREDTFCHLMRSSETDRSHLNAWRLTLSESMRTDQEDRKACREQERNTKEEMLQIMVEQTDVLRCLFEVQ